MKTEYLLLAQFGKPVIGLKDLSSIIGLTEGTIQKKYYEGTMPFPIFKLCNSLCAHVSDVAEYIDRERDAAARAMGLLQPSREAA